MTWHPPTEALKAYVSGRLPAMHVWSVESHVTQCGQCRRDAGSLLDGSVRLEKIWDAAIERIDAPRPRSVERLLVRVGVPDHVARLLAATPSLTVPWLLAVVGVLGFGLAMAWSAAGGPPPVARAGLFPFLVLAPLVPVVGVAVAFGPVVDPAYEVAVASPFHGFRLLLIRTMAVLGISMAVALGLAVLLPAAGLLAAAWILPGLALASLTLAASTFVTPSVAGITSSGLWLVGVAAVEAGPETLVAFGWTGQFVFATMLAVTTSVVLVRRESFDFGKR